MSLIVTFIFFFNDTATTEIYTLSLHDALPIYSRFKNQDQRDAWLRKEIADGHTSLGQVKAVRIQTDEDIKDLEEEIGRAHVLTPVTPIPRMPSSACKKNEPHVFISNSSSRLPA